MALIKCPECNKEISNKSKVCIGCGYPLNEISNDDSDTNCNDVIYATINGGKYDITHMCTCFLKMLKAGTNENGNEHMKEFNMEIRKINEELSPSQCRISFIELQNAYKKHGNQFPNELTLDFKSCRPTKENSLPRCPKCGGTQFTPVRKKFSLLTGFATNKVDMVCNNCGAIRK